MRIRSWIGVLIFAGITTVLANAASLMLTLVWFEPEHYGLVMWPTVWTTVLTAFPICVFVGHMIRLNTALTERLRLVAERDRLTGVATREKFFADFAQLEVAAGAILMVDIDHFKQINDQFGHLIGDAVIAAVAGRLRSACRQQDMVCRFGGEEFLVFLGAAEELTAQRVATQMRQSVASAPISVEDGVVDVRVSIGAALHRPGDALAQSIGAADAALYRAKSGGRDQVVLTWGDVA